MRDIGSGIKKTIRKCTRRESGEDKEENEGDRRKQKNNSLEGSMSHEKRERGIEGQKKETNGDSIKSQKGRKCANKKRKEKKRIGKQTIKEQELLRTE